MIKLFYKLSFLVLTLSILFSCAKENNKISDQKLVNELYARIYFPDTIIVDKYYSDGYVEYSLPEFNEYELRYKEKAMRSLKFYLTVDTIWYEDALPDDKVTDTIWSENKNKIKLFNIAISKPGIYYLSGNIRDEILFDTIPNNTNKKFPGYALSSFVSKKIVVINK